MLPSIPQYVFVRVTIAAPEAVDVGFLTRRNIKGNNLKLVDMETLAAYTIGKTFPLYSIQREQMLIEIPEGTWPCEA